MNIPHTRPNNNFRYLSHDRLPSYSGTSTIWLCSMYNRFLRMFSGFHHNVDENCTLLGYAGRSANILLTFQEKTICPIFRVKNPKHKRRSIHCPKTLVRNYQYMLHSDTEECSYQLLLKSQLTPDKEHTLSGSKNTLSYLSS
jgi:hypothetical protein